MTNEIGLTWGELFNMAHAVMDAQKNSMFNSKEGNERMYEIGTWAMKNIDRAKSGGALIPIIEEGEGGD